jgi:transcriptional regulator with XRE-family HTH domain/mannose-6-phosphate isomerase-like protein (cupin superfamily)
MDQLEAPERRRRRPATTAAARKKDTVPVAPEVTQIVSGIGPKVRHLRKQAGWSLQQLADLSDVSAAAIHKIEQSGMVPTITTLLKVAGALGRPVSYFVDEQEVAADPTVHTPAELTRPIFTSHSGISLHGITGPYGRFQLAGARATVLPGASSGETPLEHPGEELVYVVEGQLELTVSDRTHLLGPGDALHFRTVQPHAWRNPGKKDVFALWMALRPQ